MGEKKENIKRALAYNQNHLAVERTEFSKIRTELAFTNSKLAVEQTHLAYLRTIVSLVGSGATIYKALPLIGVSQVFSNGLAVFLFLCAFYFIYKDITTYPRMKKEIAGMQEYADELAAETERKVVKLQETEI